MALDVNKQACFEMILAFCNSSMFVVAIKLAATSPVPSYTFDHKYCLSTVADTENYKQLQAQRRVFRDAEVNR
jgi:hypothetical protein